MKPRTKLEEEEDEGPAPIPPEEEVKKPRKIKSRRVIKLMFNVCPLCSNKITDTSEMEEMEKMKYFQMVQFGANPDGTGYESYFCGSCKKFMMMIISPIPIFAQAQFTTGMGGQQQRPQQQGQEGYQQGQDGNGQGPHYRVYRGGRGDVPF